MTTTAPSKAAARIDDRAEAPLTLAQPAPRALRLVDQLGLWGNLGVSLLGFTAAGYALFPVFGAPAVSLAAAVTAVVVGTVIGTAAVAAAAVPGTRTGAPAMVLLRGLFGARLSWLPTVLNILQLVGWTTFELVVISTAAHQLTDALPRSGYVLIGGVITTGLALRPLGWIRALRKYVTVAVLVAIVYLGIQLLRNPLPSFTRGTWHGFWLAVDSVVGVTVSWVPVAADYSRHSHRVRDTVVGTFVGYSITQFACYGIGLVALLTVATGGADRQMYSAFMAIPLGTVAFAVLAVRELDQSFVDTYSSAVSVQNLRPRWDRRAVALVIGVLSTIFALALSVDDYYNFLILIGSVFVPLAGVFIADYFVTARGRWDVSETAPARWIMLWPWVLGFLAYQLINPGYIGWWKDMWRHVDHGLHFTPTSWMSASIISFAVAAVTSLPLGVLSRRREAAC